MSKERGTEYPQPGKLPHNPKEYPPQPKPYPYNQPRKRIIRKNGH